MSTLLKKSIFSFLAALVLLFSFAPYLTVKAQAASSWWHQSPWTWLQKVDDTSSPSEIFGERYTAAQVEWVIYGLWAFLIHIILPPEVITCVSGGVDITGCGTVFLSMWGLASTETVKPLARQSRFEFFKSVFSTDRGFSGISYIKERFAKLGTVPVAHAQTGTVGFTALTSVQDIWRGFRDVSYGLFVLVAIIFAFMIMFRVKIDPKTVITVQSAIPKIIIALVLVTFSYAIAGLLIDLMYVVIGLISLLVAPMIPQAWFQHTTYQPLDVFNLLTVGPINTNGVTGSQTALGIMGMLSLYLGPLILLGFVILIVGIVTGAATLSITFWICLIVFIIIVVVLVWMSLRTFWVLFKAFANVLLLTIFAPLQIALGTVVPNFGFGQWVRSMLSNLSVFVVTGVLWLFSWIFLLMAWNSIAGTGLVLTTGGPTRNPWPPLIGTGTGFWTHILYLGVSFVLFTLIPKSTEIVQSILSGKPFAYGSAIGEALAPIPWGYDRTIGPGVAGLQKYNSEAMLNSIFKTLNRQMQAGNLQWTPQRVKDYVKSGADSTASHFKT